MCAAAAASASRLSVGAETETLEDDEDGDEDDDDDPRDSESLQDGFFLRKRGRAWFSSLTEGDKCGYSHCVYRPCSLSLTGGLAESQRNLTGR